MFSLRQLYLAILGLLFPERIRGVCLAGGIHENRINRDCINRDCMKRSTKQSSAEQNSPKQDSAISLWLSLIQILNKFSCW